MLDEMSVLDSESMKTLIGLIYSHREEYDLVIISSAENSDTKDILSSYNIPIIQL